MEYHENPTWVDRFLLTINACRDAVKEARKYPDPQTAWDAWTSADELIWTLLKTRANPEQILLCCCELAEPVLTPLIRWTDERETKKGFRGAFFAIKSWAVSPTPQNLRIVDYFYDDIIDEEWDDCTYAAGYANGILNKLIRAVDRPRRLRDFPDKVKTASRQLLKFKYKRPIVPGIANRDLTPQLYDKWQCDTVRRFFPVTPLLKAYR